MISASPRRAITFGLGVVLAGVTAAGCFTTSADYQRDAERYIRADVAAALTAEDDPVTFASVSCTAPVDQNAGTRFACTAIDDTGGRWEFDNVIEGDGVFVVNVSRRP